MAIRDGVEVIQETDDDNLPEPDFFGPAARHVSGPILAGQGWTNIYRYFSDAVIWPRGLPLAAIHDRLPPFETLNHGDAHCPIQ